MAKNKPKVNNATEQPFYYPSLDGLRFFAFFCVFLHHALPTPPIDNSFTAHVLLTFKKNGWVGVDLFFVLSGFLITTILLKERSRFGSFSLKNFWIRRALRIWPLYFLALAGGFFIIPFIYTKIHWGDFSTPGYATEMRTQLPLYLLFLGNWAVVINTYSSFSNIAHLWTISLEEQFYLLWPLVLLFIKNIKSAFIACFSIIILATGYRYYLNLIGTQHPHIYVNTFARVDTLVFGALIGLILFYKPSLIAGIRYIFNLPLQILSLIVLSVILYKISLFNPYAIRNGTFGYLIIAAFMSYYTLSALQLKSLFSKFLSWKPFVMLGKISYGLYVWHFLGIEISTNVLRNTKFTYLMIPLAFILAIIFGLVSYYLFERFFLKLKGKFTKVSSRPV